MKEPQGNKLDGLPSIAPSRDDIESRRTTRRGDGQPVRSAPAAGGTSLVVNVVLAVLLAGLTACGWFIVTQNQALERAQAERADAEARLKRIEDRLSMTDQALSDTSSQTQDKLAYWESEIRKLWDVSNKRNKDWIEDNQAAIKKLQSGMDSQTQALAQVKAQAADLRKAVGTQDQILEQLTLLDKRSSDLLTQQRALTDTVTTLKQSSGALDRRVKDNEEAVRAIDGFRRDVVARITRLQERVDALSSPAPATQTLTPSASTAN